MTYLKDELEAFIDEHELEEETIDRLTEFVEKISHTSAHFDRWLDQAVEREVRPDLAEDPYTIANDALWTTRRLLGIE